MSKAEAFCHAVDIVNTWTARLASYLIFPLVVFTGIEVVGRYVFNSPTIWVWDVNVQLQCALIVLGAGYALLTKIHVIVDVIVNRFSPKSRAIIDLITALVFFWCIGALVWKSGTTGWNSVVTRETYSSVWMPPLYPLKMLIPIGAFLLLLQGAAKFIRDFVVVIRSKEELKS